MRTFDQILGDCISLKEEKQAKYKRQGENQLANFDQSASRARIKTTNLIHARIEDKTSRLSNFLDDETFNIPAMIEEHMDAINYHVFAIMDLERLTK